MREKVLTYVMFKHKGSRPITGWDNGRVADPIPEDMEQYRGYTMREMKNLDYQPFHTWQQVKIVSEREYAELNKR